MGPGIAAGASPAEAAPRVFTIRQRGAFRLHALDEAALACGLEPGMALADARARVPELMILPHDPEGEAALMARLATQAERYTPSVAIDPPEGLVLDIAGCAHLFGDEAALMQAAVAHMRGMGFSVRAARADTPEAALALARLGDGVTDDAAAIARLSLLALRPAPDALRALRRAGFATIGDLAALPRAPLAARFGAALVDALDRLLGRTDSRIVPRRSVPPVRAEQRFAEPIAQSETVMAVLSALLEEAAITLAERHQGGRRFVVRMFRTDGAIRDLAVETGTPVRDAAIVLRLFAERIEALADPLDPGFGFDLVRLAVPCVEPLAARQGALDGSRASGGDLAALLDRLRARAGGERFCRLVPQSSHLPERASQLAPAAPSLPGAWSVAEPGEPARRPLTLFDTPERIMVIAAVPDGPPRQFQWRGRTYRITAQEGPERIASEWWRRARGHAENPGLTRDYYRVEDEGGQRFWLFRHGLYARETDQPHWYLHGLFA